MTFILYILEKIFYFGFYFAILLLCMASFENKCDACDVNFDIIPTLFCHFSTLEFRFVSGQSVFRKHNRIIYNENMHSLMQNIFRLNFLLCHNKQGNVIATRLTIIINATAFFSICRAFRMQVYVTRYIPGNISPFVSLSQRRPLEAEMKKQPRR